MSVASIAELPFLESDDRPRALGTPSGEVRFVDARERARIEGVFEAASLLVAHVNVVTAASRGRLAETIDESIEDALHALGASAPGIGASSDEDAALADQLYRARQVGRAGVVVALPSLGALTDARGVIDADDGATLRFFSAATRDRPVVLLLDASNRALPMHGAPRSMSESLGVQKAPAQATAPTAPRVVSPPPTIVIQTPPPRPVAADATKLHEPSLTIAQLHAAMETLESISRATPLTLFERAFVEAYAPLRRALMRGEKFGSAGVARADAVARCEAFSASFSRAYSDALPTFGATGKHPRMVFELFAQTQRCARVHGARTSQIVLVDGLRWDLGRRLREELTRNFGQGAVCVEELPLWSVLPTTTMVQLDALSRGEDALRAPVHPERETEIVRGRSLEVLRRMRLGHRDVLKLDRIEGWLRQSGPSEGARIDQMASELAPIFESHLAKTPARTLVVVAGDHGFAFSEGDSSATTGPATQGGASPEEVFVPMQAWLVGGVH